jgi:hypothetical protein
VSWPGSPQNLSFRHLSKDSLQHENRYFALPARNDNASLKARSFVANAGQPAKSWICVKLQRTHTRATCEHVRAEGWPATSVDRRHSLLRLLSLLSISFEVLFNAVLQAGELCLIEPLPQQLSG